MKQITLFILFITLSVPFVQAQEKIKGNKNVTTIETEINPFTKLIIGENFEVNLIEGNKASVEIETDENLHDVIEFNVSDNVLKLHTTQKIRSSKKMNITIRYTKILDEIEVIDDAELNSLTSLNIDTLSVKIRNYGKVNMNVKSKSFRFSNKNEAKLKLSSKSRLNVDSDFIDFELSETSLTNALVKCDSISLKMYDKANAQIEGNTDTLDATLLNSNNFEGKNLTTSRCQVTTAESSDFSIHTVETITIESSGNSEVYLYGNAAITLNKFTDKAKLHKKEL